MANDYNAKDGDIIFPDGRVNQAPAQAKPHRVDPMQLVEKFRQQIPDRCSTADILQAFTILVGLVVMQSGRNKQERMSVAHSFHDRLLNNLDFEHNMAERVIAVQNRIKAEGREVTDAELAEIIKQEMKEAAEEVGNGSLTPRKATESGLQ